MHNGGEFRLIKARHSGHQQVKLRHAPARLVRLDEILSLGAERDHGCIKLVLQGGIEPFEVLHVPWRDEEIPVHGITGHAREPNCLSSDDKIANTRGIEPGQQFIHLKMPLPRVRAEQIPSTSSSPRVRKICGF